MSTTVNFETARWRMVDRDVAGRGISDPRVIRAMATVPRERFIDPEQASCAYGDEPLPIGEGQTISQPYIVARMTEALDLGSTDRVLEIGTGSGYAAAVLAEIAAEVYTVERVAALADRARWRLAALGYRQVHVRLGDGTLGWPEHGPYDAIAVTAGGPDVPQALLEQLAIGGRLVMPVGPMRFGQRLVRIVRGHGGLRREELDPVAFVPLVGAQGWPERETAR